MENYFKLDSSLTLIFYFQVQTNMNEILARVEEQNKITKAESGITGGASSKAVSAMKNINLPQLKDKVFDLPNTFKDLKF